MLRCSRSPRLAQNAVGTAGRASATDVTVGTTLPDWIIAAESTSVSVGDGVSDEMIFRNSIVAAPDHNHHGQHRRYGASPVEAVP